jgi:hypothetical protein
VLDRITSATPDQLLHIYLNDHRTGSVVARSLAERSRAANAGNEFGEFLDEFLDELDDEIACLDGLLADAGVPRNGVKLAIAKVGATLGRLKLNGRLTQYSPLSRVLEFEALRVGVLGKRQLWTTIAGLPPEHPLGGAVDVQSLIAAAERQAQRLEDLSERAASIAFRDE